MCMEFSHMTVPGVSSIYDWYSENIIPELGGLIMGDKESYRYLVESIRKFPSQPRFADMISKAGFSRVNWTNYTGGIATIHSGWKL